MTHSREPLHQRISSLVLRRRVRVLGVAAAFTAAGFAPALAALFDEATSPSSGLWTRVGDALATGLLYFIPGLGLMALLYGLQSREGRLAKENEWEWERLAALAESPGTHTNVFPRIDRAEYPALGSAIQMYQAAVGRVDPVHFCRLSRATYATRVDACVRLDDDVPTIYFTHAMLDSFSATQLLGVIAHMLERHKLMRSGYQAVLEADAKALLVTKDPDAILRAIGAAQGDRVPAVARVDNREAWFSDDQAEPDPYDENAPPRRIYRDRELRKHLGSNGIGSTGVS